MKQTLLQYVEAMMDDKKETKLDKQVVTTQITDDQGDSQVHSALMCETSMRLFG